MATLKSEKTVSNFLKKGFKFANRDHKYLEFWHDNKLVVRTKVSHNGQDLNDYLIGAMQRQCKMGKPFFLEFARCEKSFDDYLALLKKSGVI